MDDTSGVEPLKAIRVKRGEAAQGNVVFAALIPTSLIAATVRMRARSRKQFRRPLLRPLPKRHPASETRLGGTPLLKSRQLSSQSTLRGSGPAIQLRLRLLLRR